MFFVFNALEQPWMQALESLQHALNQRNNEIALNSYKRLFFELSSHDIADLPSALASVLLEQDSRLSDYAMQRKAIPEGLMQGAKTDLELVLNLLKHDYQTETTRLTGKSLPPLSQLAQTKAEVERLAQRLQAQDTTILESLIEHYQQQGTGVLSQFMAFRWVRDHLEGIRYPVDIDMQRLVGLERPLGLLQKNTLAFLRDKPAQHTLLYGPRGSGKSTAVRSLLRSYAKEGLRLIEVAPEDILSLADIVEAVRLRPHRYILFVDDLSFEQGDNSYHPLKRLLEGSLTQRPQNILIYATSNRRHLVKEQFSDRPDPLNEDVHAWDTQHERLALADRFGLTITFPDASQQRYLEIVRGLLAYKKLTLENIEEQAIRFAEWGNGYSGRTAQQFIESIQAS